MLSDIEISSYIMNAYYVFDKESDTSKANELIGLSKVAYILKDNSGLSKSEIEECKGSLIEYVIGIYGKADSESTSVTECDKDNFKIEIGAGKFEKYTGSKDKSVAIIITSKKLPENVSNSNNNDDIMVNNSNIVGIWKSDESITMNNFPEHRGHYFDSITEIYENGKLRAYYQCKQDSKKVSQISGKYEVLSNNTIFMEFSILGFGQSTTVTYFVDDKGKHFVGEDKVVMTKIE